MQTERILICLNISKFITKYALFDLLIAYLLLCDFNCQFVPIVSENYKIDVFSSTFIGFLH